MNHKAQFDSKLQTVRTSEFVTYCTCPHDEAADAEVKKLRQMGFGDAYALSGGLDAARAAGFEIVTPSEK
jgi:rhodanese-related sulfurtransferase